jgi:hypothetical protein
MNAPLSVGRSIDASDWTVRVARLLRLIKISYCFG